MPRGLHTAFLLSSMSLTNYIFLMASPSTRFVFTVLIPLHLSLHHHLERPTLRLWCLCEMKRLMAPNLPYSRWRLGSIDITTIHGSSWTTFLSQRTLKGKLLSLVPFLSFLTRNCSRTQRLTNASVSYGLIPSSNWEPPEWIDPVKAQEGREKLSSQGVVHAGGSLYRHPHLLNWFGIQEACRKDLVSFVNI